MPLRLPARRRWEPRGAKRPFRRRIPPTPQATRLMRLSLGAGLLLALVLSLLFIPKALQYDVEPPVSVELRLQGEAPFVVEVLRVNAHRPLSTYRAELNITGETTRVDIDARPLGPGTWGDTLTFEDVDADGALSVGDRFTIRPMPGTRTYDLFLFHESRGDERAVAHIRLLG